MYYEGARYYDPTTGRFTIQDSITGVQQDPMTLNRYIYARDNPERYVDPTGHSMANSNDFGGTTDPNYHITASTICVGGTCTITTTQSYGGDTSTISTQISTQVTVTASHTKFTATQTSVYTTTVVDTYANGAVVVHETPIYSASSTATSTTSTNTNPSVQQGGCPSGGLFCHYHSNLVGTAEVSAGFLEVVLGFGEMGVGAASWDLPMSQAGWVEMQHGGYELATGIANCIANGGCLPIIVEGGPGE